MSSNIQESALKKGFIPLVGDKNHGCISWQGEPLKDFWMWNKQFNILPDGGKSLQTVQVTELKTAAMHYWRDGWVPVNPMAEDLLRRMENALRNHRGLKMEGTQFPDGPFLKMPDLLPDLE